MGSSGDLTDEQGTKSELFRASDINLLRKSSDIADEVAESPIEMSGWVQPSLRSVAGSEGTVSHVVDSINEEGEGTEMVEVSDANLLRKSSEIAELLAESQIIMFGDRGNSLRNDSETEGVGRCRKIPRCARWRKGY